MSESLQNDMSESLQNDMSENEIQKTPEHDPWRSLESVQEKMQVKKLNNLMDEVQLLNPGGTRIKNDTDGSTEKFLSLDAELTSEDIKKGVKKVHMSFWTTNIIEPGEENPYENIENIYITITKKDVNGKILSRIILNYDNRDFGDGSSKHGWQITNESGTRKTNILEEELINEIEKRIQYTKNKRFKRELDDIGQNDKQSADEDLETNLNNLT